MKLSEIVKCGDWLIYYPKKNDLLDKIITKATFGKVNHASQVKDALTVFETDGDMFKAGFTPLADVDGRHVFVIRPRSLANKREKLLELFEKYKNSPYGYGDLIAHLAFFWLAAPLRKKAVSFFGVKPFMVCSELVARVTYEVTGREELRDFEAITPEDLLEIARLYPEEYEFIADYTPQK